MGTVGWVSEALPITARPMGSASLTHPTEDYWCPSVNSESSSLQFPGLDVHKPQGGADENGSQQRP